MTLLLLFAVLGVLAAAIEVLNFVAPEFLASLHREAALKESIVRTQTEVAESEKRLQALRASLRNAHLELNRAANGIEELDDQFAERRRVSPVLVYFIPASSKTAHRFRASIRKTLPSDPEESQALIWANPALVEVEANTSEEARRTALRQFPAQHGYEVGEFQIADAGAAGPSREGAAA